MKHTILFTICTICAYLPHTTAHADISCSPLQCCGQITDESGEPMPGAGAVIQPSPTGRHNTAQQYAVTDTDGYFIINSCSEFLASNTTTGTGYLRVAAVGYVPFETTINAGDIVYGVLYEDLATDDNIDCSDNEYREYDFSANASTCETCPTHNNITGTHLNNDSGNPFYTIYNCYIPFGASWTFSDSTGSGTETFTSGDCYYYH